MQKSGENHKRRRFEKLRQDSVLTKQPDKIPIGPGSNGITSRPRTIAQNIMRTIYETSQTKIDPLEAIKRNSKYADTNSYLINHAYALTDPKRVLDYTTPDSDQMALMTLFSKCHHCGMKICQCLKDPTKHNPNDK